MTDVASAPSNLGGTLKKFKPASGPLRSTTSDQARSAQEQGPEQQPHEEEKASEQQRQEGEYNPAEEGPAGSVDESGNVVDSEGNVIGHVTGDVANLIGKTVDTAGQILDPEGNVIGTAEPLENVTEGVSKAGDETKSAVKGDFRVTQEGNVVDGKEAVIGNLIEGEPQNLADRTIKAIDQEGNLMTEEGSVVGKADITSEVFKSKEETGEEKQEKQTDPSILKGKIVNKAGYILDDMDVVIGSVDSGELKHLVGKTVDEKGQIWNDAGKVIGTARAFPEEERIPPQEAPFADFPDATVDKDGKVLFNGNIIGRIIEGDAKKLLNKKVGPDGEISDDFGRVLGKAERWEEEEVPEPEPEKIDLTPLAGKRVNKAGNVVDSSGTIYGRLVEGDPKKIAGRMCDKDGNVRSESGDVVGRAELVPEGEREGQPEGAFSGFQGLTVDKNGKVVDTSGAVVGRLIEGDTKKLYGRTVDEDGDVLDKNGNAIGKAERWEEEEKPREVNPMAGLKVNREGEVRNDSGDVIGKLTDGSITNCVGKEIDNDGDIVNAKGETIGHATLLENIPPEPEESEEEKKKREELEQDKKLAGQMANCIQQSIDKVQPILRMITETVDEAERKPKEELDEQKLVNTVRPLIEEGGKILQEANGVIRGLDPDGRITAKAKQRTAAHEATPEEYHLAELLKELTGNVTQTIDNAKKKIAGMPHAKKELNPLWGLLAEPLGQILAAVGLLLSGVLGLVGRLLGALGLGGLLDQLLGGLGIKGILESLGLGTLTESLTGKKKS